jgi:hypothetical protein
VAGRFASVAIAGGESDFAFDAFGCDVSEDLWLGAGDYGFSQGIDDSWAVSGIAWFGFLVVRETLFREAATSVKAMQAKS